MPEERTISLPRLEFPTFAVSFPERGQHLLLKEPEFRAVPLNETGLFQGLMLARAESGVCVLLPLGTTVKRLDPLLRKSMAVLGIAVLHHGEYVEVGGMPVLFRELQFSVVGEGSPLLNRHCPFCRTRHFVDKTVIRCPLCHDCYCEDCWALLHGARCCSRDCSYSSGPIESAPRAVEAARSK